MNIFVGEQDLVFYDYEDMFNYLIHLEDHLVNVMSKYPEYDIDTVLLVNKDLYTIRVKIKRFRNRENYE